jgi:hypothetical protein
MSRVEKRKSLDTARSVERAAKRQCKKDERQTEDLLAKVCNWNAHTIEPKSVESVTGKATLAEECLNKVRALAKSKNKTLQWLECLPIGIRESKHMP